MEKPRGKAPVRCVWSRFLLKNEIVNCPWHDESAKAVWKKTNKRFTRCCVRKDQLCKMLCARVHNMELNMFWNNFHWLAANPPSKLPSCFHWKRACEYIVNLWCKSYDLGIPKPNKENETRNNYGSFSQGLPNKIILCHSPYICTWLLRRKLKKWPRVMLILWYQSSF